MPSASYHTLRDSVSQAWRRSWDRVRRFGAARSGQDRAPPDCFWALDDVSFDIQPGGVVGIIGRNGAGKSTLLKILSRITEPTSGRAAVRGRLRSLLEVGTGFHSELTGRENIFMNGSILGMSRSEIRRKFDEIVDFAGVERFLDTPAKRYSNGMYMRLAFAVAAFLEPEILIVDEVLAVGDAQFQRKCLGRMQQISRAGRTVLFVSHNLAALQGTCRRGIVLDRGKLVEDNDIGTALRFYLNALEQGAESRESGEIHGRGPGPARFTRIQIGNLDGELASLMTGDEVRFAFDVSGPVAGVACAFVVFDAYGRPVAKFNSSLAGPGDATRSDGAQRFECLVEELLLAPGSYRVEALLTSTGPVCQIQDHVENAATLELHRGCVRGRETPRGTSEWVFTMPHLWTVPLGAYE